MYQNANLFNPRKHGELQDHAETAGQQNSNIYVDAWKAKINFKRRNTQTAIIW